MMWIPRLAAFRVGRVTGNQWNLAAIGDHSFAAGWNPTASGGSAVAIGSHTVASGTNSMAMGSSTTASADYSTALGVHTIASGSASTAMGQNTQSLGNYSTSMGHETIANGVAATAMGSQTIALGDFSTSIGYLAVASGSATTAIGTQVSTNGKNGSLILGDYNTFWTRSTATNQFTARFNGGYRFISQADERNEFGVKLEPGANAWTILSDSTRKENFRPANGVTFLEKIAAIRLGSWNYKGQNVQTFRHYGPMAQDFFAAFGHDALGTIGEETGINQADFDGVNLIAIQALIQKTSRLEEENAALRQQLTHFEASLERLQTRLDHDLTARVR